VRLLTSENTDLSDFMKLARTSRSPLRQEVRLAGGCRPRLGEDYRYIEWHWGATRLAAGEANKYPDEADTNREHQRRFRGHNERTRNLPP
jgi:hypothetical protein